MRLLPTIITTVLLAAAAVVAQQPRLTSALVQNRSASGGLERTVKEIAASAGGAAWVSYHVPMVDGRQRVCCGSSDWGLTPCRLESASSQRGTTFTSDRVELESQAALLVLLRIDTGRIMRIQVASADCTIDAGGLPFHWLTDVRVPESLTLLAGFVDGPPTPAAGQPREDDRLSRNAITAIALHADPGADRLLDGFVAPTRAASLRKQAMFWLGSARGRHGYETLRRIVTGDSNDRTREDAIFPLSVSREPEALKTMIEVARRDRSGRVRGQALFWLAQKAGREASSIIQQAIEIDPETEVKTRAVFALSQLPPDEGVPLLINVARTHPNAAVRKKAMFWLGQSKDERALSFFEEILLKR